MRIAMSTLRGITLEESLQLAYDCGYDGIEILADHFLEVKNQEEMIKQIRAYPLSVSMHASAGDINITSSNEGIRQESIRQMKATIDLCKALGSSLLTVHPGRLSSARECRTFQREKQLEAIKELAIYAQEQQIYVGIENMERRNKEVVQSLEDLSTIVKAIDNPFLGATLDLAHLYTTGTVSIQEGIDFPIFNVHISQCVMDKPHYPIGHEEGQINLSAHLKYLKAHYEGQLVIEVKGKLTPEQLKENLICLKALLDSK